MSAVNRLPPRAPQGSFRPLKLFVAHAFDPGAPQVPLGPLGSHSDRRPHWLARGMCSTEEGETLEFTVDMVNAESETRLTFTLVGTNGLVPFKDLTLIVFEPIPFKDLALMICDIDLVREKEIAYVCNTNQLSDARFTSGLCVLLLNEVCCLQHLFRMLLLLRSSTRRGSMLASLHIRHCCRLLYHHASAHSQQRGMLDYCFPVFNDAALEKDVMSDACFVSGCCVPMIRDAIRSYFHPSLIDRMTRDDADEALSVLNKHLLHFTRVRSSRFTSWHQHCQCIC